MKKIQKYNQVQTKIETATSCRVHDLYQTIENKRVVKKIDKAASFSVCFIPFIDTVNNRA